MKTSWPNYKVPSLSKVPYPVLYPCCSVLAMGLETTPCWVCHTVSGLSFHDIPLRNSDLMDLHSSYRQGTSTCYMEMSKVVTELLQCPHP